MSNALRAIVLCKQRIEQLERQVTALKRVNADLYTEIEKLKREIRQK